MELLLLIIAILLFIIFYRLGTIKYMFFKWITYLDKEFNSDDLKVLRLIVYDLNEIMPFIVKKKKQEEKRWNIDEHDEII